MWHAYLALGDSVTAGFGSPAAGLACRSWTDLVADDLATRSNAFRYANLGAVGATSETLLRNQLARIRSFVPDLVSVTVGANDARSLTWNAGTFAERFDHIIGSASTAGVIVLCVTYPDITIALDRIGRRPRLWWRPALRRLRGVNAIIRDVARAHGASLLDLERSAAAVDPRHLSGDLTHPNALGYRWVSHVALGLLNSLAEPPLSPASSAIDPWRIPLLTEGAAGRIS